jgi:uncharacterized membrane protein YwzB
MYAHDEIYQLTKQCMEVTSETLKKNDAINKRLCTVITTIAICTAIAAMFMAYLIYSAK